MNLEKEITVNIDPTTGLPELPEGYFWEVKPYEHTSYGMYNTTKELRGYEVCITTLRETTTTAKKERWYDKAVTKTEVKPVSVMSRRLIDPSKYAAASEKSEAYHKNGALWGGGYDFFGATYYDYITPEIVLEEATKLYTAWQEALEVSRVAEAKREVSEALVGVYPPKSLTA